MNVNWANIVILKISMHIELVDKTINNIIFKKVGMKKLYLDFNYNSKSNII
jgi:hypothetical protein